MGSRQGARVEHTHEVAGNRLTIIESGADRLEALIALIDGATTSLRALYYIYADDDAGRRVHAALLAAAARGVVTSLIVDGFGSDSAKQEGFFQPLRDAGISVCAFSPRWGRRYLLRNHQKLVLADERCAIIGGFNVENAYFDDRGEEAWRDLGLIVEGEAAERLTGYYDVLQTWTQAPKSKMKTLRHALRTWSNPAGPVRWLLGGPARRMSPWAREIRADMRSGKRLDMIAAYFAPSPALLRRIDQLGLTGTARIVTASKTDNAATIGAARFTYAGLLRKGVRIFEYEPSRLHTKLYVIDDAVYIGSANFDVRSLFLNLEIMLRIDDAAFAETMRGYIDGEVSRSVEQKLADYSGLHTVGARLRNALCYFLVAVADYNVSRRLNFDAE
ncbi:phosphatidylserine/phosphatidylglycerophosphate/cardiolipin synthase family protein [Sphingomonas sp.]|uniref:phospholipase D-like domain-containing protein n=1 Tax=Sphingomonas sp. TaxID=28214 RepID=UPI0025D0F569|nr:phosphatidylserine/phosphatidylglycerophosphate/cardiolipin synthase family protein [Sphingomonas sp.]